MNNPTATLCHSSDQVFEQLLDEITSRIQAGEFVTVDEYSATHPEYADRLRRLLPAMQALLAFGQSQSATTDGSVTPPADHASGELGDFRILREIGRGGMGVVYEAEQISIGRPVALKVLPFASMLDERRLARFRNEVRAAGQLHHTNIVPIYAVGSDRGVHFYAMQLVAGQSLADVIAAMKPGCQSSNVGADKSASRIHMSTAVDTARAALSTLRSSGSAAFYRTAAQLAVQAAEALEHAHSCGVVHRDIKPSNLLIDARGSLWLTDFGLASVEAGSDLTMSGELLGTLRYMSPEQTLGSHVVLDHRTDIYSLGVTLYELLTLEPAFAAADRGELLRQIAVVEPKLPRRINPAIPPDLETIILKATAKDATSRYASAQHMADDLQRFLENKPIAARRPSLVKHGRKWAARHVAMVAISAAAFAVVGTIGGIAALMTHRAYTAEAAQRAAAEANLAVATQIIDRLLTRAADDRYVQGDLKQAEQLASDASEFYEELLKHSDDAELRFNAASAHGTVAHIWELIGRYEKASSSDRRAGELLQRLTTAYPGEPKYLAALADNYNQTGLVDWALDRPSAAEPSWRQAWEIYTELAQRFPHEPSYQNGLARMLANLACVCYFTDRHDVAEEYYRRAAAIEKLLPDSMRNSASGLASQAGSLTNRAELARLRGQFDQALQLLEASIPLHQQSLAKWPHNPAALACYCCMYRNMIDCHLGAGRPADAAATVERMIAAFPNRLEAYHLGTEELLHSATLIEKQDVKKAASYRQRAHELVSRAHDAPQRTSETTDRFAWFLLTCGDKSFRDPPRALELAKRVTSDAPERGDAWFTLALAHYRNGNWQAADEAGQNSIKFARGGEANAFDWALLSMIRAQQGRMDEARPLHKKADDWIAENKPNDHDLLGLAAEAEALVQPDDDSGAVSKSVTNSN